MAEVINSKIGFIGAGVMASAIAKGMVQKGLMNYSQLYASDPNKECLSNWQKWGAKTAKENGTVVINSDIIFLAVKPDYLIPAIEGIKNTTEDKTKLCNKLFISILAGVTIETLEKALLDFDGARVVRVMPNTPMMVGEGCSVFCLGKKATKMDSEIVELILSSCGICNQVEEAMIDAFTALGGSGPAFVFITIEALSDGAVLMGVPRALAIKLAAQTVLGSAKMVLECGKHPATLKDDVCSPGGTTIAGVYALEKSGIRAGFMKAIEAATLRSLELKKKSKNS